MNETIHQPGCSPEIQTPSAGSYFTGLIGAALGAAVGTIPWFIVSTFASLYVGWLGFIVGVCSLFGYKLLRGVKSTIYASVLVYLLSIVAIVAAYFFSNMYTLYQDAEFASAASFYGYSKFEATWIVLTDSENTAIVIKDLAISLIIGIVGLVLTRKPILKYTDPQRAAAMEKTAQQKLQRDTLGGVTLQDDTTNGMKLPFNFTITEKKSVFVVGIIVTVIFGLLFLMTALVGVSEGDSEMILIGVFFLAFTLAGIYMIVDYKTRRLEVNGEKLSYINGFGKRQDFSVRDIAYAKRPDINRLRIYDQSGKILAKIESNMQNYPLIAQFLSEHQIELRS